MVARISEALRTRGTGLFPRPRPPHGCYCRFCRLGITALCSFPTGSHAADNTRPELIIHGPLSELAKADVHVLVLVAARSTSHARLSVDDGFTIIGDTAD